MSDFTATTAVEGLGWGVDCWSAKRISFGLRFSARLGALRRIAGRGWGAGAAGPVVVRLIFGLVVHIYVSVRCSSRTLTLYGVDKPCLLPDKLFCPGL